MGQGTDFVHTIFLVLLLIGQTCILLWSLHILIQLMHLIKHRWLWLNSKHNKKYVTSGTYSLSIFFILPENQSCRNSGLTLILRGVPWESPNRYRISTVISGEAIHGWLRDTQGFVVVTVPTEYCDYLHWIRKQMWSFCLWRIIDVVWINFRTKVTIHRRIILI